MGETKEIVQRLIDMWNNRDEDGWLSLTTDETRWIGSGGFTATGKDGCRQFWTVWQDAFPDNRVSPRRIVAEGDNAIVEATFTGTHSGGLQAPSGAIPATGKSASVDFTNLFSFDGSQLKEFRVYFDQVDLLTQLGLMPGQGTAPTR